MARLPFTLKVLLENLLREEDGINVRKADIEALANWNTPRKSAHDISFMPARVILQDFTGVPLIVDLASMRDVVRKMGGDPDLINPLQQVDLVIDHSLQVDAFGNPRAFKENVRMEYKRNRERYSFLRWAQKAFRNFRVVPPGTGIVHQVNLEYLGTVVQTRKIGSEVFAFPDTLIGTDSHTTMINALGILGWGVGGIEAEAAMLGQPVSMLLPEVVGFKISGKLPEGTTATDLVLTITHLLRQKGVVGKFVEFFGPGLSNLSLPDRATIANMSPEFGSTAAFFPVDEETLRYLKLTARNSKTIDLVRTYCETQGLFRKDNSPDPIFSDAIELSLAAVKPTLAGPKRPQDKIDLAKAKNSFAEALPLLVKSKRPPAPDREGLSDGSVVIAAITSCTNTSNPALLIEAGLLAKKAAERGLKTPPWVKTSFAPGSKVVTDYLKKAGLMRALEKLGFHLVGYGCTTCIGNSGPLPPFVEKATREEGLVVCSVLSGNRNFEGRIHPLVPANYLMSPPLVVAYALAGTMNIDLTSEPIGIGKDDKPVYLADLWPNPDEVGKAVAKNVQTKFFRKEYSVVFAGDKFWKSIAAPVGKIFEWEKDSTYIQPVSFFEDFNLSLKAPAEIRGARVLANLGDSVTTDHISPAGFIGRESPAGKYLIDKGVSPEDFNSYGARRGNEDVMVRGTLSNVRLKNKLISGAEGGFTKKFPQGDVTSIYDAAEAYKKEGVPIIILAGKDYGAGSSRDWAAKGTKLLGVRAVLAESFERIHRSNLVMMGVLPLQFKPGDSASSLGLTGEEVFSIEGWTGDLKPEQELAARAVSNGKTKELTVIMRVDTPKEIEYFKNGGILPYVVRKILNKSRS